MVFFRRRPPQTVTLQPLTPPEGASYLAAISLREALSTPGFVGKLSALGHWWPNSRLARTLARYSNRDGDLLAGGMALTILISITAALTVALTLFMAILGNYPALQVSVFEAINNALPGLLKTPTSNGIVDPQDFIRTDIINLPNAIGLLIAAWTGLGVVGRLGRSIRAMFGVVTTPEMYLMTIVRNLIGALALLISIVAGSGIGLVIDLFGERLLHLLHIANYSLSDRLLTIASYAIPFIIHILVFWVVIRFVSGIRVPRRDLITGLIMMSAMALALRIIGAGVVASARGPVLATAATLVTLILWINIQMRLTLMIAAWMANPPRAIPINKPETLHFHETPNYVTMSVPTTLEWPRHEFTGELAPAPLPAKLPKDFAPYFGPKPGRTLKSWLFGPRER